jgi:ribonucleoside-diphosphate reductase alpha chain
MRYPNSELPVSEVIKNLLFAYKYGLKLSYYLNTYDGKADPNDIEEEAVEQNQGCDSGACAI